MRFEHCYRLDLDSRIAAMHRTSCWREWTRTYTAGQTDDRIDYARRRAALAGTEIEGPTLDLDAGSGDAASSLTAHAAPSASTRVAPDAPAVSASAAPAGPPTLPAADCVSDCTSRFRSCAEPCAPGPGPGCQACAPDYQKCMRRCFP